MNNPVDIKYDASRGFFLSLKREQLEAGTLPVEFVNFMKRKNTVEFCTLELIKINARIRDSITEVDGDKETDVQITVMSDAAINNLIEELRPRIKELIPLTSALANLDMLCALARTAVQAKYVRPQFQDDFEVKRGRHPLGELLMQEYFVPTDVIATRDGSRFQLISGCTMSGKTTYLRQIALLVVMAQAGSFVPAESATLPLFEKVLICMAHTDPTNDDFSSFSCEMRSLAYVLHGAQSTSLVLVDELCRNTATDDGLALAVAVCETLLNRECFVFFATHMLELQHLMSLRAGVALVHLESEELKETDQLAFKYTLRRDASHTSQAGIHLARTADIPEKLIDLAVAKVARLSGYTSHGRRTSKNVAYLQRRKVATTLVRQLQNILLFAEEATATDLNTLQQIVAALDCLSHRLRGNGSSGQ